MSNDLKGKAISGVKWTSLSTVIASVLQIFRLAILTRLLDKADFGIIAIATMVIGFTDIFSNIGLTVAIIHKQDITDDQYSSVYWTNIILSFIVFCILWLFTPLLSSFYNEPTLIIVIPLLGIQILFNGFGKLFYTIKVKELEYGFISKVKILACVLGFIVSVITALWGMGVYSLVLGQLVQVGFTQGVYALGGFKQKKVRFHLVFSEIGDFIRIGLFRLGSYVFDFVSSKLDVMLIGRFFGMDDLGIYNLAKELISKPYTIINMLVDGVASSAFARIQHNLNRMRLNFIKVIKIVLTVSVPIYVMMFVFAEPIVQIMYGESFLGIVPILQILTFIGIECSVSSQGAILQVSLGRTDIGFKWTIVRIILSLIIILTLSGFDIIVFAYGQSFISLVSLILFWLIVVKPLIQLSIKEYLSPLILPMIISILIAIPFAILLYYHHFGLVMQVVFALLGIIIYSAYYVVAQNTFVSELKGLIFPSKK